MSQAGVGYIAKREEAIAQENGYHVIQRDIELFKGVPIPPQIARMAALNSA